MGLNKIQGRKINKERIWVGDIEAKNWNEEFVMGGFYDGQEYYIFDSLEDMFNFILSKAKYNPIVYFHNFSYDFSFIFEKVIEKNLKWTLIRNNSLIYQLRIFLGKNSIYFRDSYVLLKRGLDELGEKFLGRGKIEFDYQKDIEDLNKTEIYLKNDLKILYDVLIKFFEQIDYLNVISASSLSLVSFRRKLEKSIPYKITKNLDEYGRKFYCGGRNEIFKFYGQNLIGYDVNSMYPYVMSKYEFPFGDVKFTYRASANKLGFYKVNILSKTDDYIPFLYLKLNKLFFINSDVQDYIFYLNSYELDVLDELKIRYKILEGIEFEEKDFIFKDFINELYEQRKKAKDENNAVMDYILKIIMNSLYGKFGQKRERKNYFSESSVSIKKIIDNNFKGKNVEVEYINYGIFEVREEIAGADYLNVFFSAMITSLARIELFRLLKKYESNVYYCDTDSLYLDCEIDKSLIGNDMGKLKIEKKLDEVIFLLPKLYVFKIGGKDGSVAKGFKRLIQFNEVKDYIDNGIEVKDEFVKPASFIELIKDYKYIEKKFSISRGIKRVIKSIKSSYDKRKIVDNFNTIPYFLSEIIKKEKI